jgi:hypothetical protein
MTVLLIELQKREEKNDAQKLFLSRGAQLIGNVYPRKLKKTEPKK